MTSPEQRLDDLLDQYLEGNLIADDNDSDSDAQLVAAIAEEYQPEALSPARQRRILDKARATAYIKPKQRKRPFNYARVAATLVLGIGLYFVASYVMTVDQANREAMQVAEITLETQTDLFGTIPDVSDAFGFEYGAFATIDSTIPAAQQMHDAGMGWVAFQVVFAPDYEILIADVIERVAAAHNNEFKVMVSLSGLPEAYSLTYHTEFVKFAGRMAGAGVDAIEIWESANLDRSFPPDAVQDGSYARLIEESVGAIRTNNPRTLVISGAPAPTGAESAFPGQVLNDDNFLELIREQGALDHVDCVGMNYVEGTVPPLATSGDARDDYYTRYLPTQLQAYRKLVDAELPICVTNLGYMSSEGIADVPVFFEWSKTTSREEQAQWTVEALEWLALQQDVRLAMIWHLDIDSRESGQEGYEMLFEAE